MPSAFKNIDPPAWYSFEPHQPEFCGFVPDIFVDITPVMEKKKAAMACMGAQTYLSDYYAELAARRANHARRISGQTHIQFAEAHQSHVPRVATIFSDSSDDKGRFLRMIHELSKFSTATIHEALGKVGNLPSEIKPIARGMKVCGPAYTVQTIACDNKIIHRAYANAASGDVMVVHCSDYYEAGYWGDLMSLGAKTKGLQEL